MAGIGVVRTGMPAVDGERLGSSSRSSMGRMGRAGTPTHTMPAGRSVTTAAPAPTTLQAPTRRERGCAWHHAEE